LSGPYIQFHAAGFEYAADMGECFGKQHFLFLHRNLSGPFLQEGPEIVPVDFIAPDIPVQMDLSVVLIHQGEKIFHAAVHQQIRGSGIDMQVIDKHIRTGKTDFPIAVDHFEVPGQVSESRGIQEEDAIQIFRDIRFPRDGTAVPEVNIAAAFPEQDGFIGEKIIERFQTESGFNVTAHPGMNEVSDDQRVSVKLYFLPGSVDPGKTED
jgi:hypothetical protein